MKVMERVETDLWVPRGHGKVELFDERGRLKERVPFENFLSADTLAYQKFMARKAFWAGMAGTSAPTESSSATATGAGGNANANEGPQRPYYWRPGGVAADWEPYFPMSALYCSDSSKAEAPSSEVLAPGTIVAWANRVAYTGVDTKRGTPDQVNCAASATMAKWVFDWPTTAGNGTIRSVGWTRLDEGWVMNAARSGTLWGAVSSTSASAGQAPRPNPHRLAYNPATGLVLYWGQHGVDGVGLFAVPVNTNSSTKLFAQPANTNNPGAMAFDGTGTPGVWLTHSSGSHLRKYSLAGVLLSSATRTSSPVTGSIRGLAFDGTDLWATSTGDGLVYRISTTTGEVLSSFDTGLGATLKGIAYVPSMSLLVVAVGDNSNGYFYTTAGVFQGTLNKTNPNATTVASQHDDITCYDELVGGQPDPQIIGHELWSASTTIPNLSDTMGFRGYRFRSLGSRTLLPVDVVKDSTKTMKVTYQFDFV